MLVSDVYVSGTLYNKSVSGVWYQSQSVRHVRRGNFALIFQSFHVLVIIWNCI